ncbi:hypothetical protein V6N12_045516 [Hibiscus sabdariffa]|uniref:Reverse transcriptase zinc-binding domain-containing protein n=1 Tax=Hibiscus sabdariffa TaxID=183260 RepID=A0ABR2G311_9ROSI
MASECTGRDHPLSVTVACMVDTNGDWDWNRLNQWLPHEKLEAIAAVKLPRLGSGADIPGWRWERNRIFSVRSAYKALMAPAPVGGDRIMTNAERKRRNLAPSDACASCLSESETIAHVLRDCSKARQVWEAVVSPTKHSIFFSLPFLDWILQCVANVASIGSGDERWSAHFATICWLIWKQRSSVTFGNIASNESTWVSYGNMLVDDFTATLGMGNSIGSDRPNPASRIISRSSFTLVNTLLVEDVLELMSRQWNVILRRVNRGQNVVVDKLAALSRDRDMGEIVRVNPPGEILDVLHHDMVDIHT